MYIIGFWFSVFRRFLGEEFGLNLLAGNLCRIQNYCSVVRRATEYTRLQGDGEANLNARNVGRLLFSRKMYLRHSGMVYAHLVLCLFLHANILTNPIFSRQHL